MKQLQLYRCLLALVFFFLIRIDCRSQQAQADIVFGDPTNKTCSNTGICSINPAAQRILNSIPVTFLSIINASNTYVTVSITFDLSLYAFSPLEAQSYPAFLSEYNNNIHTYQFYNSKKITGNYLTNGNDYFSQNPTASITIPKNYIVQVPVFNMPVQGTPDIITINLGTLPINPPASKVNKTHHQK